MNQKNRFSSDLNNPDTKSDLYITENERLFGDNFATGEYYRRKEEFKRRQQRYKFRQNQLFERERRRWERLDYDYIRREN